MMRKYLMLLIALCLHCAARGQTGWQYEYWFDNDYSTTVTSSSSLLEADVSRLSESLHAIHIQIKGNGTHIHGLYHIEDLEDPTGQRVVVNAEVQQMLSVPLTRYFVKVPPQSTTARCWIDNDISTLQTGVATGQTVMLDMRTVSDGFHCLYVQPIGQSGMLGTPRVYPFVKIPQTEGVDHMTCLCMIDDHLYKQENVSSQGGIISWQIDVSSLPQGFHRLYVQVVTPSGTATVSAMKLVQWATTHSTSM